VSDWLDKARPCKLGTVPTLVHLHGSDRLEVGKRVRIKEREGDRWHRVLVTAVHLDGYFKADR
jgi:hypothetical protein